MNFANRLGSMYQKRAAYASSGRKRLGQGRNYVNKLGSAKPFLYRLGISTDAFQAKANAAIDTADKVLEAV